MTFGGLGRSSGSEGKKGRLRGEVPGIKGTLLGVILDTFSASFFFGGLREPKKGVRERVEN